MPSTMTLRASSIASGAVCTPSRHMIMSGRTVWHLPIAPGAMAKGLCPPGLEQDTIPAVFNRAGYDTMRTCKMGNSQVLENGWHGIYLELSPTGLQKLIAKFSGIL